MKKTILMFLVVGAMASVANAGMLMMSFRDGTQGYPAGTTEVTLSPSDTVYLDIVWRMQTTDKKASGNYVDGMDLRFNLWSTDPAAGETPTSVVDDLIVAAAPTSPFGWVTGASDPVGGQIGSPGGYFLAGSDTAGTHRIAATGAQFDTLVLSVLLHKSPDYSLATTYLSFMEYVPGGVGSGVIPAVYMTGSNWTLLFGYPGHTTTGPKQFTMGTGNPGDNPSFYDPYHGYDIGAPLIVHNIPEPGSLALLALGGLALLRRR